MDDSHPRAAAFPSHPAAGDAYDQGNLSAVANHQPQQRAQAPSQDVQAAAAKRKYLTDTVPGLDTDALATIGMATKLGDSIRQIHTASALEATLAPLHGAGVGSAAYLAIRDHCLRQCGAPSDPIEEMLIEQMVLSNYHIGQLHVRAAEAKSAETAKVFYTALCRMQAESRKLALALQAYRSPPKSNQFTVVKQANIAAGDQQVAFIDNPQNPPERISAHDAKLIPNEREGAPQAIENHAEYCQPTAYRGQPRQ